MDSLGKVKALPQPIFSLVSLLVMTVQGSASVPVPAVVGMATMGSAPFGGRLALAAAGEDVVPVLAGVLRHHGDALGRVDRAAAAQAEHEVALVLPGDLRPFFDVLDERVRLDLVVHDRFGPVILEQPRDPAEIAMSSSSPRRPR